jgi:hypothetical protein
MRLDGTPISCQLAVLYSAEGWLSTLDFVHSKILQAVREFGALRDQNLSCPEYSWLEAAAKSALEKCKNYYDLAQSSPAYCTAEVLQPTRKWGCFTSSGILNRKKRVLEAAKKSVQELWGGYKYRIGMPKPTMTLLLECRPHARQPDIQFGHLSEHKRTNGRSRNRINSR